MIKVLYKISEALKSLSEKIQPYCGCMAMGSTTVLPSAGAFQYITFINELDDTHDSFDGTTFTVPSGQAGLYDISALISATSDDGVKFICWLYVNDATSHVLGRGIAGATNICGFGGSVRKFLDEGDTVNIAGQLYNALDTTVHPTDPYNYVSIYRIH